MSLFNRIWKIHLRIRITESILTKFKLTVLKMCIQLSKMFYEKRLFNIEYLIVAVAPACNISCTYSQPHTVMFCFRKDCRCSQGLHSVDDITKPFPWSYVYLKDSHHFLLSDENISPFDDVGTICTDSKLYKLT